jgi:predicted TPR repeat methyltransferase
MSERADTVLGVDASPTALAAARRRLTHRPGVTLAAVDVSRDWPEGSFDLVVISEVGYFLSPAALDRLVDRVAASLTADGVVVLCHWRHRVQGWVMNADEVHRRFADGPVPPLQARYTDRDAELRVHAAAWPAYDR